MEEIRTQLYGMPLKVYFYDGPKILQDIKEFKPDLLNILTNIEGKLTTHRCLEPSNKELLSALKNETSQKIDNFYSDLSFFVGSFDSNLLLHLDITTHKGSIHVSQENWARFRKDIERISSKHQLYLLTQDLSKLEAKFKKDKELFEGKENKDLIKELEQKKLKYNDTEIRVKALIDSLKDSLKPSNNHITKTVNPGGLAEREIILDELKFATKNRSEFDVQKYNNKGSSFNKEANHIASLIHDQYEMSTILKNISGRVISKPSYKVTLKVDELKSKILQYKDNYIDDIQLINNRKLGIARLKNFLSSTEKTLSLISQVIDKGCQISKVISFKPQEKLQDRVSVSPHDIFDTGNDIAVYGGAGVGKTTTLKAYADILSECDSKNLIYIPLNRLVDEFKRFYNEVTDKKILKKDLLVKIILLSKGIQPTNEMVEDANNFLSGKLVIILDGLDEVYNAIPDIIPAISEFKLKKPMSQLIISSRDCVSYLSDIDFLGITLLPFTEQQLDKFIQGWFKKDEAKATQLIDSIKQRDLFEYIKTPLLATITCSLVQKGVDAPSSENEIYSERLNLLTGEYDLHKNIERQKQKGELLRKCAMKIAFKMHNKGIRSELKENIKSALISNLADIYSAELLDNCVEELINPCDILTLDPITKKYSFGHFRFQEHLASAELSSNRGIDLVELVTIDWWRGALSLYAQDNDISYLIEDVYKHYGNVSRALITLNSMVNSSPQRKQRGLRMLLKEYKNSDLMDDLFTDVDYGYEHEAYFG
ncbi:hypothetical protein ESZ36_15100 [Colwellia demingiae]|uniref:NACHT domain-containing protein n=1 Tax=Colwellia demingiae TaxID=89401 RepID=A0A5C6QDQ8_9GAMM|nr:hypothetical protein [Colwellia demingiae]TWX66878.1 hypothetical protein ESZ36_15100 [Colwellia demingiae]